MVIKNPEEKLGNVFIQSKKIFYVIVTRMNFPSYGTLCSMTSTFPVLVLPPMHFPAFCIISQPNFVYFIITSPQTSILKWQSNKK